MARQLTARMEQVLDMRRARMSYRQIGTALGLDPKTVHECHQRALKYINEVQLPQEVQPLTRVELKRIEESEYIDGQLARYHEMYDKYKDKSPRVAIEALNGAHRYLETLIKLQGIAAPEKHRIEVSVDDLRAELMRIEAEIGESTEEEAAQYRLTPAA